MPYVNNNSNSALAASSTETFIPSLDDRRRNAPFNGLLVQNRSGNSINVDLNGDSGRRFSVASKGVLELKQEDNLGYEYVVIGNTSTTTAIPAGEIILNIMRLG